MSSKFKQVSMKVQDPIIRSKNFEEVSLGYSLKEAMAEAERCLECPKKPCVSGCPVNIDIPAFIHHIKKGDISKAYKVLTGYTALPAVCGRVCPQETQCEARCIRGKKGEPVAIGALERFVADYMRNEAIKSKSMDVEVLNNDENIDYKDVENRPLKNEGVITKNKKKVAVVGSGPAGLSCAGELIDLDYAVTVFEALHETGGVLRYGIPEFRLPKEIVDYEIQCLMDKGVKIEKNVVIGKSLYMEDLVEEGYEAVFLGTGAGLPRFMNIPGENLLGVYSANEFLTRVNLMKAYKKKGSTPIYLKNRVAVIGGGNVAMDAARCAKRMGAEHVYLIYRRSEVEMPARLEEILHAKEEGIELVLLTNPKEIIGDSEGYVTGISCVRMILGEPDAEGRRRPIEEKNSEFLIAVDNVIMSIGTLANPLIGELGVSLNQWGLIETDEGRQTSIECVYAGGDVVSGAATVINAMGAGKACAREIHHKLL